MAIIRDLDRYRIAIHDAGKPYVERLGPVYGARSQSKLAYMASLMLLVAAIASFTFTGMSHTNAHLFASIGKPLLKYTADILLIAGFVLAFLSVGMTILRLRDKMILNAVKTISLEDPNQRLLALAGKPEKRNSETLLLSGKVEREDSFVHYAVDMKATATTQDKDNLEFAIGVLGEAEEVILPLLDHAQCIFQKGNLLTCVNRGDNVAFLIRTENNQRKFILLSEPQSNNPYFKEKRQVITKTTWQAGDQLVIGARKSPATLHEKVTEQTTFDATQYVYLYEIDEIVKWAEGKKIVL